MADCYWHGYSGGSGPCSQCEREDKDDVERGSLGLTIDPSLVHDLADISSIGREAAAKNKKKNK